MMMTLTGKQLNSVSDALLDGLTTVEDLRDWVRIGLNNDLDEIALGDDLRKITFRVVDWAQQNGHLGDLLDCACSELPENQKILQARAFWLDLQSAPPPSPPPKAPEKRIKPVVIEGDDTTVVINGSPAIRSPATSPAVPPADPSPSAPAHRRLYMGLIIALMAVGLLLLAFLLSRLFTYPQANAVPTTAPAAPALISAAGAAADADYVTVPSTDATGAFSIMRRPVTNAQYQRCVEDNHACRPLPTAPRQDPAWQELPVTGVSWHGANDYAAWAGGRLPSAAEWQVACRAARPSGTAPGLISLHADIWEWTATPSSLADRFALVSNGGSCTFRDDAGSRDQLSFVGFRLLKPIAPG